MNDTCYSIDAKGVKLNDDFSSFWYGIFYDDYGTYSDVCFEQPEMDYSKWESIANEYQCNFHNEITIQK